MSRKFYFSCILTFMDVLVFALCVDKGLTPAGIIGACYIALRCFGKDSQEAVNLAVPAMKGIEKWVSEQKVKMEARKEDDASEE